jgi:hypothetical protein
LSSFYTLPTHSLNDGNKLTESKRRTERTVSEADAKSLRLLYRNGECQVKLLDVTQAEGNTKFRNCYLSYGKPNDNIECKGDTTDSQRRSY